MIPIRIAAAAAGFALFASVASADTLKLSPANPQPDAPTEGLAVQYAYPDDVKSLSDASAALGAGAEDGAPLAGLDYLATDEEPNALTSSQEFKVAAKISGYMRFDAAGTYTLEVYSNDGLELSIGGQEIARVDEKRGCDPIGAVEVEVPDAGWYAVEALYWQRKGGSCLIMEWSQNGSELDTVPADLFAH